MARKGRRGNSEGSLYRRADGMWVGALSLGPSADGKPRRKTVSSKNFDDCRRKLRKLEADAEAGLFGGSGVTFAERADDWLAEMKHHLKPRTSKLYKDELAHAVRVFGNKPLSSISAAHVRAVQRAVAESVGPNTAKKVRDRVSAVLEAAFRDEQVPRNVTKHVKAVKQIRYPVLIWSSAEIDLFLETVRDHRLYALFHFYLSTGARRSEALALKWTALDFKTREVRIHETITVPAGKPEFGTPKTEAGHRTVPGGRELFEVLGEHRERQKAEKAACPVWQEHGLVFPSLTGRLLVSLDKTWGRLKGHAARAGALKDPPLELQDIRVHDLRHTFVSMCIAAGMDAARVAEIIGHTDPSFTYKIYAHVFKRYQRFSVPDLSALKGEQEAAEDVPQLADEDAA